MSREVVIDTKESVSPLCLRGFKLHSLFMRLSDGTELHQVTFPRLQGDVCMTLVTYEGEAFPSTLRHHLKMEIDLQRPAEDHWNVASDRVLPATMDDFRQGASPW